MNDANASNDPGLKALIDIFPRLFRGAQPRVWSHVPPGWADIVATLFSGIDSLLTDAQARQFRVEQVKEKFGLLRIYVSFDRIDPAGVSPDPVALDALVDAAVAASGVTCCVCGGSGRMRSLGGWRSVRCEEHANGEGVLK